MKKKSAKVVELLQQVGSKVPESRIDSHGPLKVEGILKFKIRYENEHLIVDLDGGPESALVCAFGAMRNVGGLIEFSKQKENQKSFTMQEKQDMRITYSLLKRIVANEGNNVFAKLIEVANAQAIQESQQAQTEQGE